jgi:hypothetical protein
VSYENTWRDSSLQSSDLFTFTRVIFMVFKAAFIYGLLLFSACNERCSANVEKVRGL